jgi:hypothetical protein
MKTRTYFTFRIDVWDDAGDSIFSTLSAQRTSR